MRKLTIGTAAAAMAAVLIGVPAAGNAATGWQTAEIPAVDADYILTDTAALNADDVWAVGTAYGTDRTVLLHWNGTAWTRDPGPAQNDFRGWSISGISGSDVWTAGHCVFPSSPSEKPCAAHWDGTAWSTPVQLPPPDIGTTVTVQAIAADDVWIAGGQLDSAYYAHYDGTGWSEVPAPSGHEEYITDLAASGPDDVWAAGYRRGDSGDRPLIQHWNGRRWSTVKTPDTAGRLAQITTFPGSTRVWAVGNGTSDPLVLRRSGNSFSQAPEVPGTDTFATGVAPDGSGGAWIALTGSFPARVGPAQTGTTHYAHFRDGAWKLAQGGTHPGTIRSWVLTRVPGTGSLYAVGSYSTDSGQKGYIERYGG